MREEIITELKTVYDPEITSINIFDITGKQILVINTINSETKTLDISNFSNGIYFMIINSEVTKRLIKN